jgi:putative aminopeptidase
MAPTRRRRPLRLLAALPLLVLFLAAAPPAPPAPPDTAELEAFLKVSAVTGREETMAELVRSRLGGLPVSRDALGNVVVTLGSGSPRRLAACPLGEPGFAVSGIQEDGYLRLVPVGSVPPGALWEQAHEGHAVVIDGAKGPVVGVVAVRSVHLQQRRPAPDGPPFTIAEAYVDVGAQSSAEVAAQGIRLLDPVTLLKGPPVHLANGLVAAPAARLRGAALALVKAARRYSPAPGAGTVVYAWTTGDLLGRTGLEHLLRQQGPFDEAFVLSTGFGASEARSGVLVAGAVPRTYDELQTAPHLAPPPFAGGSGSGWGAARVAYLGIPALYPETPVEAISPADVESLARTLVHVLDPPDGPAAREKPLPSLPPFPPPVEVGAGHADTYALLKDLLEPSAVSGAEGPVRERVLAHLPAWAHPVIDAKGNVRVTFGSRAAKAERLLFVAHMDEVGFAVEEVLPDGRLRLARRGGLLPALWEAQPAVVFGQKGPLPGVFEPRPDWASAEHRNPPRDLTVSIGAASAAAARALGAIEGTTVTMPKAPHRLGLHRATGRSCDDRVGSTALLLALRQIDPARLARSVTFAWTVGEEVGLEGAKALAGELPAFDRVYPVDTFVSSDSPIESRQFAFAPLGTGAVLRAMDNASLAPRALVDRTLSLAGRSGIPVQVGMTGGATDGMPFVPGGAAMLPLSWPGRYSHSPVEVADLRDVEALVRLIVALANELGEGR